MADRQHTGWIIGYGNPQRRDDGIGPFVVERLKDVLDHNKKIILLTLHQLAVELIEEMRAAAFIIFVDATSEVLESGSSWTRLYPEIQPMPCLTHHVHPAFLLGMMRQLYRQPISAWLVSIQGYDFGYGEGVSSRAEQKATEVVAQIVQFVDKTTVSHKKDNANFRYRSKPWGA